MAGAKAKAQQPKAQQRKLLQPKAQQPKAQQPKAQAAARAESLADQLLEGVGSVERAYFSQESEVFTADAEADIDRFSAQFQFCSAYGLAFPCLEIHAEEPIPVDFTFGSVLYSTDNASSNLYPHYQELDRLLYSRSSTGKVPFFTIPGVDYTPPGIRYSSYPPEETKGFLKNRLIRFLLSRFQAKDQEGSPPTSPPVGVPFQVITKYNGFRVHYSPAYFFNPSLVFGSPTSPVLGFIQPGRYVFGVAGRGLAEPWFSTAEVDIPPEDHIELVELDNLKWNTG